MNNNDSHSISLYLTILALIVWQSGSATELNARLSNHPSPYLQAHAGDAITWYPLTSDIVSKARTGNRPILLSSGYQSCYWCYRMKQDSFKDTELGRFVNTHFIPVLIDRDLQPEQDQQLQQFMLETRGFSGWPLTLILTSEGDPVTGFTYTPVEKLRAALERFHDKWKEDTDSVIEIAAQVANSLSQDSAKGNEISHDSDLADLLETLLTQTVAAADSEYGGFGDGEKFPYFPTLEALLELQSLNPSDRLGGFLQTTAQRLLDSGIRDQLGGGIFRYIEDRQWQRPHFEQLLGHQAMAGRLLIRSGIVFDRPDLTNAGLATLKHMLWKFRRDDGFYRTALSAVGNDGKAGSYYLWETSELESILGEDWRGQVSNFLGESASTVLPDIQTQDPGITRKLLSAARERRSMSVDDKALLGENGLALSGLAYGSAFSPLLQQAGQQLANRLIYLVETNELNRMIGAPDLGPARLSDLVYLARGLADWSQVSPDSAENAAQHAITLLHLAYEKFHRDDGWIDANPAPLTRQTPARFIPDNQLPSPSALWLDTVWRLAQSGKTDADLLKIAEDLASQRTVSLNTNSFFHATAIASLVGQRVRTVTPDSADGESGS